MKCHVVLLLTLSVFSAHLAFAQADIFNEHITQPDAWRPARVIEPGVDAKGDLGLALPIMTIPGRNGFDYTVTLGYQSGIQVLQEPSWIGLGWSFDPGSIVRDVQGGISVNPAAGEIYNVDYADAPDIQPDIYYVTTPGGSFAMTRSADLGSHPSIPHRNKLQGTDPFVPDVWRPWKIEPGMPVEVMVHGVNLNRTQTYPDLQTAVVEGPINYIGTRVDFPYFVLTDENGVRYIFAEPTLSTYNGAHQANLQTKEIYVDTWRLVAMLGSDFPYAANPSCLPPDCGSDSGSWIRFKYKKHDPSNPSHVLTTRGTDGTGVFQVRYLEEIETPTHRVVFDTVPRTDTPAGQDPSYPWQDFILHSLSCIELKAKSSGDPSTDPLVRNVCLSHDNDHYGRKRGGRLRLTNIAFFGSNGSEEPGYTFIYHETIPPNPDDTFEDDFGYYNTEEITTPPGAITDDDTEDGKAWSLRYLDYPTGGRAEFIYENDEIADGSSVSYEKYDIISGTPGGPFPLTFTDGQNAHQGGVRVKEIKRYLDSTDATTLAVTTTFDYGIGGQVSGMPAKYMERLEPENNYFKATARGKAAVYYDFVKRIHSDDTFEKTSYTTQPQLQTTMINNGLERTVVTGNQHIQWGISEKTEWGNNAGSGMVYREVDLEHILTAQIITDALPNTASIPPVHIVWRRSNSLDSEAIKERLDSGGLDIVSSRDFTYDDPLASGGTGQLQVLKEKSSPLGATERTSTYTYGYEITDPYDNNNLVSDVFEAKHILSAVVKTDIEGKPRLEPGDIGMAPLVPEGDPTPRFYASSVTVWQAEEPPPILTPAADCPFDPECILHPYRTYQWYQSEPVEGGSAPLFSNWEPSGNPAGGDWKLQTTFEEYDAYGHVVRQKDALDREIKFFYRDSHECDLPGGETLEHAFLTCIEVVNTQSTPPVTLQQTMGYDDRFRLNEITDSNGNTTSYTYDPFGRLETVTNTDGQVAQHSYALDSLPPFVETTVWRAGNDFTTTRTFFDGLGRPTQVQSEDRNNKKVVVATEYDSVGREHKVWKPYRKQGNFDYDALFASAAQNEYGSAAEPNVLTTYKSDGLSRVDESRPPYSSSAPPPISFDYGVEHWEAESSIDYRYTNTTDEVNQETRTYLDGFGNTIRVNGELGTATEFVHDPLGNVLVVMPPNFFDPPPGSADGDWVTRYTYDTFGRLTKKRTPDADGNCDGDPSEDNEVDYQYTYDDVGNLRFVVDPARSDDGACSNEGYLFTDYDDFNRVVKTGLCTGEAPPIDPNQATNCSNEADVIIYTYDTYNLSHQPPPSVNQNNPLGNLTQVEFNNQDYYQYFYDNEGRVEDFFVHLEGLGDRLIEYAYDRQGNVTQITYQDNDPQEKLTLSYTYDKAGRLKKVKSETPHDGDNPVLEASYDTYRATGQVEMMQLGPEQIDYSYHIRDWLTTINDPASPGTKPFALGLDYENNGNVAEMEWATEGNATFGAHVQYDYSYDALNRLLSADFCRWEGGNCMAESAYDVGFDGNGAPADIEYDSNGNITSLHRWLVDEPTQQPLHSHQDYDYSNGNPISNRLQRVTRVTSAGSTPYDFAYDANGNMTRSRTSDPGGLITYERRNLPTRIPLPGDTRLDFRYDADGQRIYKALSDTGGVIEETFYIRGVDGAVIAVHVQDGASPRLEYWNILSGGTVLGRIVPPSN